MSSTRKPPRVVRGSGASIRTGADVLSALNGLVDAYSEYKVIAEQEATRREEIRARGAVELERIRTQRELFMHYLERSFDERKLSFVRLFAQADSALARGDSAQLGLVLGAITQLAATSPFKALADIESTRKALLDPEQDWDV